MGILDHMALGDVGFSGVVVWLGECILGRSGESEVVGGLDGADVDSGAAEVDLGGAKVPSRAVQVDSLG